MQDLKILNQDYKVVFGVFLGAQLMSIVINIISLSCPNWVYNSSLTEVYPGWTFIDYYSDCDDDDDYFCELLKKRRDTGIAYIILVTFGMLSKTFWIHIFTKSFYMNFYFKLGLGLGFASLSLQLIALIQYMVVNEITFQRKYDDDNDDINPDYEGQGGDGPRLSVLIIIMDFLLLSAFVYIWKTISEKNLPAEQVEIHE